MKNVRILEDLVSQPVEEPRNMTLLLQVLVSCFLGLAVVVYASIYLCAQMALVKHMASWVMAFLVRKVRATVAPSPVQQVTREAVQPPKKQIPAPTPKEGKPIPSPKERQPVPSPKERQPVPSPKVPKGKNPVPSTKVPKEETPVPSPKERQPVPSTKVPKERQPVPSTKVPKERQPVPSTKERQPVPSTKVPKERQPVPSTKVPKERQPVPSTKVPKERQPVPSPKVSKERQPVPSPKERQPVPSTKVSKEKKPVPSPKVSKERQPVPSGKERQPVPSTKERQPVPSPKVPKEKKPVPSPKVSKERQPVPSTKERQPVPSPKVPKEKKPVPSPKERKRVPSRQRRWTEWMEVPLAEHEYLKINVPSIQDFYKVNITFPGDDKNYIVITGDREPVTHACLDIQQELQLYQPTEVDLFSLVSDVSYRDRPSRLWPSGHVLDMLSVDEKLHSKIIGRAGKTVDGIRKKHCVDIYVPNKREDYKDIHVLGWEGDVDRAVSHIHRLIRPRGNRHYQYSNLQRPRTSSHNDDNQVGRHKSDDQFENEAER
ncbi:uncharacterized protein [Panulirus ornatus]|uniref:uncharacterized protein n=1 Tax=Panulirus ornatus TaxID=150431 RepID=UPI003A8A7945